MTANLKTNTVLVGVSTALLTVLCAFAGFAYSAIGNDIQERKDDIAELRIDIKILTEKVNQSVWMDSSVILRLNNHINNRSVHNGQ